MFCFFSVIICLFFSCEKKLQQEFLVKAGHAIFFFQEKSTTRVSGLCFDYLEVLLLVSNILRLPPPPPTASPSPKNTPGRGGRGGCPARHHGHGQDNLQRLIRARHGLHIRLLHQRGGLSSTGKTMPIIIVDRSKIRNAHPNGFSQLGYTVRTMACFLFSLWILSKTIVVSVYLLL